MFDTKSIVLSVREMNVPCNINGAFREDRVFVLFTYQLGMFLTPTMGLSRYLMDAETFSDNETAQIFQGKFTEYVQNNDEFQYKATQ